MQHTILTEIPKMKLAQLVKLLLVIAIVSEVLMYLLLDSLLTKFLLKTTSQLDGPHKMMQVK
jgi:hypothetical protein